MHVVVVSAEGVKQGGELAKILLELLLPLTDIMHAVICRKIVKLAGESPCYLENSAAYYSAWS